jgi:hypothetical protein
MRRSLIAAAALIAALPLTANNTRAGVDKSLPPPALPAAHAHVPAWWWAGFACPASVVLSALVADFRDNRQLTAPEAGTCGLLYWIPMPVQPAGHNHH